MDPAHHGKQRDSVVLGASLDVPGLSYVDGGGS